jgi:hypothetical protein
VCSEFDHAIGNEADRASFVRMEAGSLKPFSDQRIPGLRASRKPFPRASIARERVFWEFILSLFNQRAETAEPDQSVGLMARIKASRELLSIHYFRVGTDRQTGLAHPSRRAG